MKQEEKEEYLEIFGARKHNLKNIHLKLPLGKLIVFTGVSGSGKSSLAFDTIYAEGQRRYLETFSSYVRQFIGGLQRPEVDQILGLCPVIAIDQKTTSRNPRSTVGTVTEIYDFLRLLYARISEAYSYVTGKKMEKLSDEQILRRILENYADQKVIILAPVVRGRKGHYREEFEKIAKHGYSKVRVDGIIQEITPGMQVERYKVHDIEVVIDRLVIDSNAVGRLTRSIETALNYGKGSMLLLNQDNGQLSWFCRELMDPESGISYPEPEPNFFSFNSPYGACTQCHGLGQVLNINEATFITDPNLPISKGAIAPLDYNICQAILPVLNRLAKSLKFSLTTPWKDIPTNIQHFLLYGKHNFSIQDIRGFTKDFAEWEGEFLGIANFIKLVHLNSSSEQDRQITEQFLQYDICPLCQGSRLKRESLYFKIDGKNIYELCCMDISHLQKWFENLETRLTERQNLIAADLLKEIRTRIGFLMDVGLDYLTLARNAQTLSGGEAQRIRLATQIGSKLMSVLYILDEPSIGLHPRDNQRLIRSLKSLRDIGNTVLVVEHDKEIMLESDYLVDIGPKAGENGGKIVAQGPPPVFMQSASVTAEYLSGIKKIKIPQVRRTPQDKFLVLKGARGNNLKNVTLRLPLGLFICITGVSGSGKSSLITQTLYPLLHQHAFGVRKNCLPYDSIEGLEYIDKVIEIDQKPIGRTPRSNPATYTGLFTHIRELFAMLPESQVRGYRPGRFSFNVKGGRCEACGGAGVKTIEMNFLPDVYVTCSECRGRRYNRETLEVRYKGKSISDVLNMTVSNALEFFSAVPPIRNKLQTLDEVGLGYIKIGQPATTLSGGEAQRMKIAAELSKKDTGKTFYILDEPTTGLHFQDIEILLQVLSRLVGKGNTILVIEHNLDVIKVADWVIDLGPEGGVRGGQIVAEGPPEVIAQSEKSITGKYLKAELLSC
ncbi:MAG: excinuclease ABC subunit UvrA [Bacteroidia bacterium]|nr:excinuclease ABC subunit UvrA [Bacteroidia bacterium]